MLLHRDDRPVLGEKDHFMRTHRFPVDRTKIDAILEAKSDRGVAFPRIGIFIVSYNASHRLVGTIRRIPPELLEVIEEIYVFDDFSTDDTLQLVKELARSEPWAAKLRVFRNPRNYGYGGNQKIGFAYALERGLDHIILLHGDGQYAPEVLPDLIWPVLFQGADVVFGSRMLEPRNALRGGMPLYKWVGNQILSRFQNSALNMHLSEFHTGYRLYGTAVLKRVAFEANSDGFHFDTQVIIQCRALGVGIHEIPIPTYYGDEICHVSGLKYAWDVCYDVLEYRLHQLHLVRRQRYVVDRDEKYKFKESPYSSHSLIIDKVRPGSVVLDVGCGRGLLAKALARRQVHIVGTDVLPEDQIAPEVAEYHKLDLEQHHKLHLKRQFDCIILADVIEHLRNEEEILRHLKQFLESDGRLIISTGNVAVWFYRLSLLIGRFNLRPAGHPRPDARQAVYARHVPPAAGEGRIQGVAVRLHQPALRAGVRVDGPQPPAARRRLCLPPADTAMADALRLSIRGRGRGPVAGGLAWRGPDLRSGGARPGR